MPIFANDTASSASEYSFDEDENELMGTEYGAGGQTDEEEDNDPIPSTQDDVDDIPSLPVSKIMIDDAKICLICLEEFRMTDIFKQLTCAHEFHGSCIDRWLLINGSCAYCRQ